MSETLVNEVHYIIGNLVADIQRSFNWSNAKVSDLIDSMNRGYSKPSGR